MQPYLNKLPNEIFERIVSLLELQDICKLRLTSHSMAIKAAQGHFRAYYRTKHVDVTEHDLRAFVDATKPGRLGCETQHIVLVGLVFNTKLLEFTANQENITNSESKNTGRAQHDLDILRERRAEYEQMHKSGVDVTLLAEAFSNIATNNTSQEPRTLSLEVIVYREGDGQRLSPVDGGGWRLIWRTAAETFHIAIRSLTTSKMPIAGLNLFNSRHLQRCSLSSDEFSLVDLDNSDLAAILADLKSLSISFSNKVIPLSKHWVHYSEDPFEDFVWEASDDEYYGIDDMRAKAADTKNFIGFHSFLQLCGRLEELKLHQYRVENFDRRSDNLHGRLLYYLASNWNPPLTLRSLELRGVDVNEIDLLKFIRSVNVRDFSMYHIRKLQGTFREIFDFCSSERAAMEGLYMHQLVEEDFQHIFFDVSVEPVSVSVGSDTLDRKGTSVKLPITYRVAQDTQASSTARNLHNHQMRVEYGPP